MRRRPGIVPARAASVLASVAALSALAAGLAQPAAAASGGPAGPSADVAALVARGPLRVAVLDLELRDETRARTLPLRLRVPQPCAADTRRSLVLFSHGLGGSRAGGAAWGEHWASHGFAVAHLQHPGSDESLWRDRPVGSRSGALREGMGAERYVDRLRDVPAVLDALDARVATTPSLACIDVSRVGMSGHSFGALTTQAIAGQRLPRPGAGAAPWGREPRVVAAVAFSPSLRDGPMGRDAFAELDVPFLSVTGSRDGDVAGTGATPEVRRAVHDALPPAVRRLLWLEGADHMVFNGGPPRPGPPEAPGDDRRVQRVTAAVTLAFWFATLSGDPAALAWLDGGGPRALLGPGDAWLVR
ncbi:MAG: hypothetical protein RJA99_2142 [Pseudomonadota bacterium]|jgi:predicted dienelactone hydrolase